MKKQPARPKPQATPNRSPQPPHKPLKPRPRLLLITSIIMALWIAALIVMYFTTVFPARHRPQSGPATSSVRL